MLLLILASCGVPEPPIARTALSLTAGAPVAGVAEGWLDLPVGGPLGGYSSRCDYLDEAGQYDNRVSQYVDSWSVSAGLHTRQAGKVLWLENGDQHTVVIKADLIYSHDVLVERIEAALIAATGEDLDGRVILTASHTHNGVANYSEAEHFYLGGDKYNEEIGQRLITSLTDIALSAYDTRQEAALGMSVATDWDPEDRVYRDRRGENNAHQFFDDIPAGAYKDPTLWVLRVDDLSGEPLGMFFGFGIHGTLLEDYNVFISTDAVGGLETVLAEQFDTPVVVAHIQGAAGDASPAGFDKEVAQIESIGIAAVDTVLDQWASTPTAADPIFLETVSRAVSQERDEIAVTRDGTVDWRYPPFDEGLTPDEQIYGDDGSIASPLDEFNAEFGGAFCGDEPLIESGTIGSTSYPYSGCMDVELVSWVVQGIFELTDEEVAMPFTSATKANTAAMRIGPLPVRGEDGGQTTEDLYFGFFPAEPTAVFAEQFRRRASDELGLGQVNLVGYAQDHEGYFLTPEDWLLGGYETTIAIWGPLQAEHVMEGILETMDTHLLTDVLEPQDITGAHQPIASRGYPLPTMAPDRTPDAGTAAAVLPEGFYNPFPLDTRREYDADAPRPIDLAVSPEAEVGRVQGLVQFAWMGGDPGVDLPEVTIERRDGEEWSALTTAAGRTISSNHHDMLLLWQPDPLYPIDAEQTHTWWVGWQPVGHVLDRPGIPEGSYRLRIAGQAYAGGAETWPWPTEDYEVFSPEFEITAAVVDISLDGDVLSAWLQAPEWGYRLIDAEGSSRWIDKDEQMTGENPVRDATVTWTLSDGSTVADDSEGSVADGRTWWSVTAPESAVSVTVVDGWGNAGVLAL
ncbi:MAG: neutral/alkaline non-lysosomal ceramidase N-terminal domain-containing protein [Myxococcota bacterium]|nr:neutral/alkaline non-lysosomal ceramidase N-terminal domain-containing protein [Myxococcota bacterium]